jgi:hypothetical protein
MPGGWLLASVEAEIHRKCAARRRDFARNPHQIPQGIPLSPRNQTLKAILAKRIPM